MTYVEVLKKAKEHILKYPETLRGICPVIVVNACNNNRNIYDVKYMKARFQREEVPEQFQGEFWDQKERNNEGYWWNMIEATRQKKDKELMQLKADFLQYLIDKHNGGPE